VHTDQLDVDEDVVRRLVGEQFPAWRPLGIRRLGSVGTDHTIFRVGTGLAARFPRHPGDPDEVRAALEAEAAAVRELAGATTFPVSEPIAIGHPGAGYPLPWSVQAWLTGHDATVEDPAGSSSFAEDLATLISELRAVDTRGRTFQGGGRGGHLPDHDRWMETCVAKSEGLLDADAARTTWARLRTLPREDPDAMCHGDLIPPNLLVRDGRLAGVLDFGGFGAADPALDLVVAWHVLDDGPRELLRRALGCGEVQWLRGAAWAFQQAMGLVWYYVETNPTMSAIGRRTLARIASSGVG